MKSSRLYPNFLGGRLMILSEASILTVTLNLLTCRIMNKFERPNISLN